MVKLEQARLQYPRQGCCLVATVEHLWYMHDGASYVGHGQVATVDLAIDLADGVEDAGVIAVQPPQDAAAPAAGSKEVTRHSTYGRSSGNKD